MCISNLKCSAFPSLPTLVFSSSLVTRYCRYTLPFPLSRSLFKTSSLSPLTRKDPQTLRYTQYKIITTKKREKMERKLVHRLGSHWKKSIRFDGGVGSGGDDDDDDKLQR